MAARKPQRHFPLMIAALALVVGFFCYKNVLPYHFSPQWQPTDLTLNTSGAYDASDEIGVFHGQVVRSREIARSSDAASVVLGDNDATNKRVEVDLANQRVYAFEGVNKVMDFVVSTGKWGRTPTGVFTIAYKTAAQTMAGGSRELGTYYYLPNVQFVQFFGNKEIPWSRGFSFHGTYWHENFGTPMSHGCVNMRNIDAAQLYEWTTPASGEKRTVKATPGNTGTRVVIYGTAPKS